MNQKARDYINSQHERSLSSLEYRQILTMNDNLSFLCHNSLEINRNMQRYLSINGIVLTDQGRYCLVLFREHKDPKEAPLEQALSHLLVRKAADEVLWGSNIYFFGHIDWNPLLLLSLPIEEGEDDYSDEAVYQYLEQEIRQILEKCKEEYAISLSAYSSRLFSDIRFTQTHYDRLYKKLNYHRFLGEGYDPLYAISARHHFPALSSALEEDAALLSSVLTEESSADALAEKVFTDFRDADLNSTEELKVNFADFINLKLDESFRRKGIPLNSDEIRDSLNTCMDYAVTIKDMEDWFSAYLRQIRLSSDRAKRFKNYQKIIQVRSYIDLHFREESLNVNALAQHFAIKQSLLSSGFKKLYGQSTSAYILHCRMEMAENLLLGSEKSIAQICRESGFGSVETFYRLFHKLHKCSPKKWRSKN